METIDNTGVVKNIQPPRQTEIHCQIHYFKKTADILSNLK